MQLLTLKNNQSVQINSPEQLILWNYVQNLIAWTTITPLHYTGVIAGSEFLTYAVGKLYVCYNFIAMGTPVANAASAFIEIHNEADTNIGRPGNNSMAWDVTAVAFKYGAVSMILNNFYFSRFVEQTYTGMSFSGFRLNV
jgi:hypothetical protein